MKPSLPFTIKLKEKYNEVNVENFVEEFIKGEKQCIEVKLKKDLTEIIEKGNEYRLSTDEMVELAVRYAFNKREFKNMLAYLIEYKNENTQFCNESFIL